MDEQRHKYMTGQTARPSALSASVNEYNGVGRFAPFPEKHRLPLYWVIQKKNTPTKYRDISNTHEYFCTKCRSFAL